MSNTLLKVFDERILLNKKFRVYGDFDNPYFAAKDVAAWIDYCKTGGGFYDVSKMIANIDENEKSLLAYQADGQIRNAWFLTEDGLYELLMLSKKPFAKTFKKEVKEVLRQIRRRGIFATEEVIEQILEDPDFAIKLLTEIKQERIARRELEEKVNALEPKANIYDAFLNQKDNLSMKQFCQPLGVSYLDMFKIFREQGWVCENNNYPIQKWVDRKYLTLFNKITPHGTFPTLLITPSGADYFIRTILSKYDLNEYRGAQKLLRQKERQKQSAKERYRKKKQEIQDAIE